MAKSSGRCAITLRWQPAAQKSASRWVGYFDSAGIASIGLKVNDKLFPTITNGRRTVVFAEGYGRALVQKPDGGNPNLLLCKVRSTPVLTKVEGFVVRSDTGLEMDLPKDFDLGTVVPMREPRRTSSNTTTVAVLRAQIEGMMTQARTIITSGKQALAALDNGDNEDEEEDEDDEDDEDNEEE